LGGEDDEGDERKPNATADACKDLYKKWNEIMIMLNGALGSLKDLPDEEVSFLTSRKAMILMLLKWELKYAVLKQVAFM